MGYPILCFVYVAVFLLRCGHEASFCRFQVTNSSRVFGSLLSYLAKWAGMRTTHMAGNRPEYYLLFLLASSSNLQVASREPSRGFAQTSRLRCANLQVALRRLSLLRTFKWRCANLQVALCKPPSGVAQTSKWRCANLQEALRKPSTGVLSNEIW